MIIGIDFDGTCVTHEYPEIGKNIGAERVLQALVNNGNQLVLCTMRGHKLHEGRDLLQEAIDWFGRNGIELYGVNKTPFQETWTDSPKPYAHLYIDDSALGCPKMVSDKSSRPYVDWDKLEEYFKKSGIIDSEWEGIKTDKI
jgi:hypothetical protein